MADDLQSSEELAFVAEEVDRIILVSIEACLKDEVYDELQVSHWVDAICESIMKALSELRKPLKYIGASTLVADATYPPLMLALTKRGHEWLTRRCCCM